MREDRLMRVYKELSFGGDKLSFETLFSEIYSFVWSGAVPSDIRGSLPYLE